ncbi:Hypothetical_protein [Hexamita inflata]|uniref:Hypothetical_protein n=1 Tax=Hexamita inflata TaxID=28002 RepID=A0AA86NH26_9EUKA|nr:Hypothetical protein HINF_LOCUS6838 [Hexamita inflata]
MLTACIIKANIVFVQQSGSPFFHNLATNSLNFEVMSWLNSVVSQLSHILQQYVVSFLSFPGTRSKDSHTLLQFEVDTNFSELQKYTIFDSYKLSFYEIGGNINAEYVHYKEVVGNVLRVHKYFELGSAAAENRPASRQNTERIFLIRVLMFLEVTNFIKIYNY